MKRLINPCGQSLVELSFVVVAVITGIILGGPYLLDSINSHFKIWDTAVEDSNTDRLNQGPVTNVGSNCVFEKKEPAQCGMTQCGADPTKRYFNWKYSPLGCQSNFTCEYDATCCSTPVKGPCWRSNDPDNPNRQWVLTANIPPDLQALGYHSCGANGSSCVNGDQLYHFTCGNNGNQWLGKTENSTCMPRCKWEHVDPIATKCPVDTSTWIDDKDPILLLPSQACSGNVNICEAVCPAGTMPNASGTLCEGGDMPPKDFQICCTKWTTQPTLYLDISFADGTTDRISFPGNNLPVTGKHYPSAPVNWNGYDASGCDNNDTQSRAYSSTSQNRLVWRFEDCGNRDDQNYTDLQCELTWGNAPPPTCNFDITGMKRLPRCPDFMCHQSEVGNCSDCGPGIPVCGNKRCESDYGEGPVGSNAPFICPEDCSCGNGSCEGDENHSNCSQDCFCGNGKCDSDELINGSLCPSECCGNGSCQTYETNITCPSDCTCNNNGLCDPNERIDTCWDCQPPLEHP